MSEAHTNDSIILRNVRLAFCNNLYTPGSNDEGKPRWTSCFILTPDHPQLAEVKALLIAVAKKKWPTTYQTIIKTMKAKDMLCLHDGDLKTDKKGEIYDGFAGNMFISGARSLKQGRPLVINRNKQPITEEDGVTYPGCFVNAKLEFWAMDDPSFGRRINSKIITVQFARDGDAFSGGGAPDADGFDELDASDMDDEFEGAEADALL